MGDYAQDPVVRMEGITKRFGTITALSNVDFTVERHEVVGLLGDNGAGKSTLIKVLTGVHTPTSGQIYFEGKPVEIRSPRDARALGIETCYQDLALVPLMSITRNFYLGRELMTGIGPLQWLNVREMDRQAREALKDIGIHIPRPTKRCRLSAASGSRSPSAAPAFSALLLILDEPPRLCRWVKRAR